MKTVKKKSTGRAGKQVLSTSEARANFAEALATARVGGAVIGFDRYGKTVAALVPVEAVYMLAGMGDALSPAVRTAIKRQAVSFVEVAPSENLGAQPARASRAKKAVKKKPVAKSSRRRASRG